MSDPYAPWRHADGQPVTLLMPIVHTDDLGTPDGVALEAAGPPALLRLPAPPNDEENDDD